MTKISDVIAATIEGMPADAATAYLRDVKRDVLRKLEQEADDSASRIKELRTQTQDELDESIAKFDIRNSTRKGRQEQDERMQVIKEKQNLSIDLAGLTTMPAADFAALDAKRVSLVAEAASLQGAPSKTTGGRQSPAYIRKQAIAAELASLPGNPDLVIPPPAPPEEEI